MKFKIVALTSNEVIISESYSDMLEMAQQIAKLYRDMTIANIIRIRNMDSGELVQEIKQ